LRDISSIVIHCTAIDNPKQTISAIKAYHLGKGWKDIGYHYLIDFSGEIWKGRGETDVGAHCLGQNQNSIGICLFGNTDFKAEQFDSLADLVRNIKRRYPKIYHGSINGHNAFTKLKTCPNFDVRDFLFRYGLIG